LTDQRRLTAAIFAPLVVDPLLIADLVHRYSLRTDWMICDWAVPWAEFQLLGRFSVWFPPPELARQLLTHLLDIWSEVPWTTEVLLVIPRVLSGFWFGLSKHLYEVETFDPRLYPLLVPPVLPIPVVVLHLPSHVRSLPTRDRLAKFASPSLPYQHWHQQQATQMRELPSRPLG
jgi:hypothetical protein